MIGLVKALRARAKTQPDFWLAGQFDRRPHLAADRAIAAWSEHLGRESAELWVAARANEGRGR